MLRFIVLAAVVLGMLAVALTLVIVGLRHASASHNPNLEPCPDCGRSVSLRAPTCPHCGCPLDLWE